MNQVSRVIDYYNGTLCDYRFFWNTQANKAMHYGYFDEKTRDHDSAVLKMNEVVSRMGRIKQGERVLDAGCGYGSSAQYLAKNVGCQVIGLTIVHDQAMLATQYVKDVGVSDDVKFEVGDYAHTAYEDKSFDVFWGLESICHALDKKLVIEEAYRLLNDGGRMIIADYMSRGNPPLNKKEQQRIDVVLEGWEMPSLPSAEWWASSLKDIGFRTVEVKDFTLNVLPNKRYRLAFLPNFLAHFIAYILLKLKVITLTRFKNVKAFVWHKINLKNGLWQYTTVVATK